MRVLITGATGFVGAHLAKEFAGAGHTVVGVDLNPPSQALALYLGEVTPAVRFVRADLGESGSLEAIEDSADAIVHAAVVTSTPEVEAREPQRVVAVNLLATLEALRYARRAGTRRFVYVSSSGVYGETDPSVPVAESAAVQLTRLYTLTKYASEQVVASANGRDQVTSASVRIAAPYGPMERPTGARTTMSVIHALVRAAMAGKPVRLSGADWARDWTHAADIAGGIRLLVEAPSLRHACYNLSSGVVAPLALVADTLAGLAPGFTWQRAAEGRPDIDGTLGQRRGPLDIARIRAVGFAPRYTLEEGLDDTLSWVRRIEGMRISMSAGGAGT
jgi:nucleoside-diphosphate-sugar epimerase